MNQYPSFGSSNIDQPRHCEDMSDREQEDRRIRILESEEFGEHLESKMENRVIHRDAIWECQTFTREELALVGYYIGMCDKDGLYRYLKELIGADVESVVRKMEE